MKFILSPGRAREPSQISLSASLSRRLKTNGTIKGGQSPMFPKKRGAGFENVEPSSPKVTCIGQVTMKTKKQGKKMRTRSKRREGGGGENVSFRRAYQNKNRNQDYMTSTTNHVNPECLPHRNQRWVHLPDTICEGLRAFGAELNCFTPCRSNCMKEKEEAEGSGRSSRGAFFSRWLMAVQEGEGKGREIKLVVGEQEGVEKSSSNAEMMMMRSQRRHVFEEIEFKEEMFESKNMKTQEEGRVSICIPPKNALLLMRCRSDPVKIAALANKSWEAPEVEEEEQEDVKEAEQEQENEEEKMNLKLERECQESIENEECEKLGSFISVEDEEGDEQEHESPEGDKEIREVALEEMNFEKQEKEAETEQHHQDPVYGSQETETSADLEKLLDEENAPILIPQREEENLLETESEIYGADNNVVDSSDAVDEIAEAISSSGEEPQHSELQPELNQNVAAEEETEHREKICQQVEQLVTRQRSEPECPETQEDEMGCQSKRETVKRESIASVLPDCLPLMMCDPKPSMENKPVSTVTKTDGGDDSKKRISVDSNPIPVQQLQHPTRSSCSHPSAVAAYRAGVTSSSMANVIEQKVIGGEAYEQFMLTRCKSEPRRSGAKLAGPEACFWKNRKLEPHRAAATLGVSAAGVGC